jgi:predicted MFS family arabinose efflux permease
VTGAQIGLAITAPLLAVALIAPVAGGISDRFGRKRLIVAAMLALIVPTLLVATSATLPGLLTWRFVQGLLFPFIFTVTVAYVADECSGPDAIRTSGIYASGSICGGFTGRFVAGLVSDAMGWRAAFMVVALLTALAAVFLAWALPMERRFRPVLGGLTGTLLAYRTHLRNGRLLATCCVGFGMLFSQVAAFTFVNLHLSEPPFALSPTQLGSVFVVYLLGMVVTPVATILAVRIGRRPAASVAMSFAMGGIALTLSSHVAAVIAGLALMCVGLFTIQALAIGFIGVAAARARSSAVGLYVTLFYIGGAAGGVAPAWLWHRDGWSGVVGILLAVMAAMAAIAVTAWRDQPRRNAASEVFPQRNTPLS